MGVEGAIASAADSEVARRHSSGVVHDAVASLGAAGGFGLSPRPCAVPGGDPVLLAGIGSIWDAGNFRHPRAPIALAPLNDPDAFNSGPPLLISDMPIALPGQGYRIPSELIGLREFIQSAIDVEHAINPAADGMLAYLTLERGVVERGEHQRRSPGPHSDSVQGPRITPKTVAEHGYLCVSGDPPMFHVQPFTIDSGAERSHWLNALFRRQLDPASATACPTHAPVLFDAYCVHASVPASHAGRRTFARLLYSARRFDRLGNTHNHLLDYDWPMLPRPVPRGLIGEGAP